MLNQISIMKNLKNLLLSVVAIIMFTVTSQAQINASQTYVSGYTKADGTYVSGYYKTTPNTSNRDNFSTKPNVNPYTNQPGYVQPDTKPLSTYPTSLYSTPASSQPANSPYSTPSYSTPALQTGPRGGTYYINRNGNKTYVKP